MSNVKQMGLTIREQATALTMLCASEDYDICPAEFVDGVGCPFENGGCASASVEHWIKILQNREAPEEHQRDDI